MAWYDEAVFYHIYPLGLCGCAHENDGQPTPGAFAKLEAWAAHAAKLGCTAIYIGPLFESVIMEKVYKGPFPNRFLASLSPFLLRHMEEPAIRDLVSNSFRAFFARNVMQYDYWEHPVYLTGSIAWYYQDILKDVAREFELRLGTIVQSPVQGLIHYHCVL